MKKYIWEVLGLGLSLFLLQKMFFLHRTALICIGGSGLLLLPVVNRCIQRTHETKVDFFDITTYMEQLLCSYKRLGIITPAIEDCMTLYPKESRMGGALQQALHILRTGEGVRDNHIVRTALAGLQDLYPSRRLRLLHEFLDKAEKLGGDLDESLDILLRDLQMWKRRVILYQKKKQFIRMESVFAGIMALVLCSICIFLMPWNLRQILTETGLFQASTAVVIILLMLLEVCLLHWLTGTWLDVVEASKQKNISRQRRNYQMVKKQRAGIGGTMAKRVCRQKVEQEYPYWLLSITLYLQQESVYQAVRSSWPQTEGFFAEEVKVLIEGIYADPVSLKPYTEFFRELEIPELQTGMKLLYAVNSNSYIDTGRQIRFLVEQNNVVMDQCEQHLFQNRIAGLGILKQIPLILACLKMIFDMVLLLLLTIGKYLVL